MLVPVRRMISPISGVGYIGIGIVAEAGIAECHLGQGDGYGLLGEMVCQGRSNVCVLPE